jgi:microfibrillar-associated protein 1
MSDAEVLAEKAKEGTLDKDRKTMKFMQKYWHKGAYYQEEIKKIEEKHDWHQPTGEDQFVDKSLLPKVLCLRFFNLNLCISFKYCTNNH